MKKLFSSRWVRSKKPSKQRKYRINAPLHIRRRFLNSHLSKELKQKYKRRSFPVRKGDTVKVVVGDFKKKIGKISRVNLRKSVVYIEGIERMKRDGTKVLPGINPSNLVIQELNLDDKLRRKALESKLGGK
ncbi:50S ribosomal protein L24 [Candidatus Woesearchaeota archaeon]|nr:50S ribosomal protein L24 [Candidatus Woesearchaeota archaeon]